MKLPNELRTLVNKSVAILGNVIQKELGDEKFKIIESLRLGMASTRASGAEATFQELEKHLEVIKKLKAPARMEVAHSFTLMLEVMNACENAYRNHRLRAKAGIQAKPHAGLSSVTYVLTAHPTEARSPHNIAVFHQIQNLLTAVLDRNARDTSSDEVQFLREERDELLHSLELAWRTSIVRSRSPKVKDEAEHIYSLLFRDNVLFGLIRKREDGVPFYVRSWVGGDKDGHPGVNEKTLLESLTLSRHSLCHVFDSEISQIMTSLKLFSSKNLQRRILEIRKSLRKIRTIRAGDAGQIWKLKVQVTSFKMDYYKTINAAHPSVERLDDILRTFPAMVVPLELRESSDILMKPAVERKKLAIFKMLQLIAKISKGGDPRGYARGLIISMTQKIEHIKAAAMFELEVFGYLGLPIIPLFEEASSLDASEEIVRQMLSDKKIKAAALKNWGQKLEVMVGYSDSAKEAGVLTSRLAIAKALPKLEKVCEQAGLVPVFFHGSGGSIDRGGGSIEDQTSWWPKSALRKYKVTVQGEMVERSFASPEIAKRQFESILENASAGIAKPVRTHDYRAVDAFAEKVSRKYRESTNSADFLKTVEAATPYTFLSALKIGSRPSKRTTQLTVKGLRAIPWVLCWTQTRVLFQTWWGVGSAWKASDVDEKRGLKESFKNNPVFTSYIKALGFTLAKVQLPVWQIYLSENGMEKDFAAFKQEFDLTVKAYQEICEHKEYLWYRPWLGESIQLRSAMIHPLNLLQIAALKSKDLALLRVTVTGISSGMMTTG